MTTTIFDLKEKNFSIVGVHSRSKGEVYYNGYVRFHGTHQGKLQMPFDSKLTIERSGFVSGEIDCHELEVHGQLKGNCRCSGRMIIYPGGQVSGEIQAESLVIYPGAQVNIKGDTITSNFDGQEPESNQSS